MGKKETIELIYKWHPRRSNISMLRMSRSDPGKWRRESQADGTVTSKAWKLGEVLEHSDYARPCTWGANRVSGDNEK